MMTELATSLPLTLLAQYDDVFVFQTAAFNTLEDAKSPLATQSEQARYGQLNLGLHVNDSAPKVLGNRMRLLNAINQQLLLGSHEAITSLHWVNQVHGTHIYDIDISPLNMKPMAADAMVSSKQNLGLAIMTADCVPIVLYQPATGQMAAIHAGWQGLACGVIQATSTRFDNSAEIKAWIGVCISQSHYEVGYEVCEKLQAGCKQLQLLSSHHLSDFSKRYTLAAASHNAVDNLSNCATVNTDKVKLDLPKIAADQLLALNITLANTQPMACSYDSPCYYSYRRQTHLHEPATGRMALVIVRSCSSSNF